MLETIHSQENPQSKIEAIKGVESFKEGIVTLVEGIEEIPTALYEYSDLITHLNANRSHIKEIPDDFYRLEKLRILFLSWGKQLRAVPDFSKCASLEILGLQNCSIETFEEDHLPENLKWLMLTNNNLTALPKSIGKLTSLKKLALAGNKIHSLPHEMSACRDLELLRVSANNLQERLPDWICSLPKLAYLGDSGNPYNEKIGPDSIAPGKVFETRDIEIDYQTLLNRSPSSEVYPGKIVESNEPIAYKNYINNNLTSDGYPRDEMRAFLFASSFAHPSIVSIVGSIHHADGIPNLVMPMLDPSKYKKLGSVPNFSTIARDTFVRTLCRPAETVKGVRTIASTVSSALTVFHEHQLAHGDLYAHNILADGSYACKVTDFGAASFYSKEDQPNREFIEVRAFGYLLDDMLNNLYVVDDARMYEKLVILKNKCLLEEVTSRPTFAEIFNEVEQL